MDTVIYEDFSKLDIRIGKIIKAEKIEKADKLLKLSVDVGEENPRIICAGIAMQYQSEEIIGKIVPVLINLKPRVLKGVESQGMILMVCSKEGELAFLSPEKNPPIGSKVA